MAKSGSGRKAKGGLEIVESGPVDVQESELTSDVETIIIEDDQAEEDEYTGGPVNPNIRVTAGDDHGTIDDGETEESSNGNGTGKKRGRPRRAVQEDLPGTEDRRIKSLHDAALEYVNKRDERMMLGAEEKQLKDKLLGLMHKHEKKSYQCDGIIIDIVPEGEKLVVKAPKKLDDEDDE